METYEIDSDAGRVVRWLRKELKADPSRFRVTGWLSREMEKIPCRRELRLGDAERQDLSEVVTHSGHRACRQDGGLAAQRRRRRRSRAPHIRSGMRERAERPTDLETFYKNSSGWTGGTANVTAEPRDSAARDLLTALIDAIEEDRHDFGRGAPA
jgi:hypothetical protein